MIRLLVEVINLIGCIIAAVLLMAGIALVLVCLVIAMIAWVCFSGSSELYNAHSPKEASS